MIHQKKNRGHRTSKIVKSRKSCSNGHLPYHLLMFLFSARTHAWRGVLICVRSMMPTQKQLARTSLTSSRHAQSRIHAKIQSWSTIHSVFKIRESAWISAKMRFCPNPSIRRKSNSPLAKNSGIFKGQWSTWGDLWAFVFKNVICLRLYFSNFVHDG